MKRARGWTLELAALLVLAAASIPAQAQRCPWSMAQANSQMNNYYRSAYTQPIMPTRMPTIMPTALPTTRMQTTTSMSRPTTLSTSQPLTYNLALNLNRPTTQMRSVTSVNSQTTMRTTTTFTNTKSTLMSDTSTLYRHLPTALCIGANRYSVSMHAMYSRTYSETSRLLTNMRRDLSTKTMITSRLLPINSSTRNSFMMKVTGNRMSQMRSNASLVNQRQMASSDPMAQALKRATSLKPPSPKPVTMSSSSSKSTTKFSFSCGQCHTSPKPQMSLTQSQPRSPLPAISVQATRPTQPLILNLQPQIPPPYRLPTSLPFVVVNTKTTPTLPMLIQTAPARPQLTKSSDMMLTKYRADDDPQVTSRSSITEILQQPLLPLTVDSKMDLLPTLITHAAHFEMNQPKDQIAHISPLVILALPLLPSGDPVLPATAEDEGNASVSISLIDLVMQPPPLKSMRE